MCRIFSLWCYQSNKAHSSCRSISSRYKISLEENRKVRDASIKDKRQLLGEEKGILKRRHVSGQLCIPCYISILKYVAGKVKKNMTFHVFNVLRQTITENEDLLISLDKAIISLDEDARFDLTLKKSVVKNFPPDLSLSNFMLVVDRTIFYSKKISQTIGQYISHGYLK